ncbi:zinc-dependent metalloprotease [Methylibium sp.]|uniref:zinc-dependent metalloprotease n=1 Tax=Methylibium sp. TaxID=2067992 RepID=UPI003D0AD3CE
MKPLRLCLLALAWSLLAGCATLRSLPAVGPAAADGPGAPSRAAAAVAATAASAPAPAPGAPPAFALVIKDAKASEGLFTLWRKDEKLWLELKPEDLNKPFFFSPKLATGIGEAGLFGGLMAGSPRIVEFRRLYNQVQLIAPNLAYTAAAGTPTGRAVQAAFSPSLVASAAVASLPHPQRKSFLVEVNALFLGDLLGIASTLDRSFRQGYAFDARNSAVLKERALPDAVSFEVLGHYATARLAQAQPGAPVVPSTPLTVPDARSLFVTVYYAIAKLPDTPMASRAADPRVGYFQTVRSDFSDDLARSPRQRFVNRWRLEKQDPAAAISEPVKPITYWLDRSIPEKYRGAITAGALEWNKAFERIGFRDAIRVEVQPDDADFDTLDVNRASVRWMTNAAPSFGAIGPSHVDPRSGEIIDADIAIESLSSRSRRTERAQVLATEVAAASDEGAFACTHADGAAEQLGYALDVLEARGELDPGSLDTEAYVLAYLKDVTMHEVGHTLGLRHNFRASRVYGEQQLADPAFTATHALTGSVMEYAAVNLPTPGRPGGSPFQTTLGPYDYWAIEYGYKPVAPADEAAELARIAARSAEPELAYGTDEDNGLGIDPESLQFDLGSDPVAFARKRFAIARDLLARQETRELPPGSDYAVLRRSVSYALRDLGRASTVLARQIGGVRTLRDASGSGRDPLQPLPAAQQREALDTLSRGLLAADSIRLSSALQRRLAPDFAERTDAVFSGETQIATDYSLVGAVLELQRNVLAQLMSDAVAARLLDSQGKASAAADTLPLAELYERLTRDVWSELRDGGDIPPPRRELQREHVNRLAALLLRPGALSRADARSLLRAQSRTLLAQIASARRHPGLSAEARAHLADSADTLSQALAARPVRTAS